MVIPTALFYIIPIFGLLCLLCLAFLVYLLESSSEMDGPEL